MFIVKKLDDFDISNLLYFEQVKNNIIEYGFFIKLIYSTHFFTLNGVYLNIPFIKINYDTIYNSKYKYNVITEINKNIIMKIKTIEFDILKNVNLEKIPEYKLYDKIKNGIINFYSNSIFDKENINNYKLILKISGIWINENSYGLSYKFINSSHL